MVAENTITYKIDIPFEVNYAYQYFKMESIVCLDNMIVHG